LLLDVAADGKLCAPALAHLKSASSATSAASASPDVQPSASRRAAEMYKNKKNEA